MESTAPAISPAPSLRPNILSPIETLAQSISTIAPSTTPTITVPLIFALAGNGTWLAYLIAMGVILLIGLCISRFARYTSNSGSLYTYATASLPPVGSALAGWTLLLAYIATGCSVTGGFISYANVFTTQLLGHALPTPFWAVFCVAACTLIAYRDVQISTQLMLWIEAASVLFIGIVLVILLYKGGFHLDHMQLSLQGVKPSGVQLGVVLAIFSFVGFESATALGAEAVNPLRTIPRAVIQSAFFAGVFFMLCAYLETQGMAAAHQDLGKTDAPFRVLANYAGVGPLGVLIDVGVLVSTFACTLACITAAARVLLHMAHNGLAHRTFATAHATNATPAAAVLVVGAAVLLPTTLLAARGVSGMDIYGWLGSIAVYGFLTAYALAALALPIYLKRHHHLSTGALVLSIAAVAAAILAFVGSLYPYPTEYPYNILPYFFLAYVIATLAAHFTQTTWNRLKT